MELLARQQKECLEEIIKIKTNYKKDSERRKTVTYIKIRINKLEFLWSQFANRNIEIEKLKESNLEHPYFKNNYFEEAEKLYEAIFDLLQDKLDELMEHEKRTTDGTTNTVNSEDQTEEPAIKLLRVQEETIRLLDRLIQTIKTEMNQPQSGCYYQHKLTTVEMYWNRIMLNHTDMIANPSEAYQEYIQKNTFSKTEDNYQAIVILLQEKLGKAERNEDDFKLPRMVIPIFDGDYQNWTSFHDIFIRLIHNNARLGEAEKMQYLKTNLKKEAASLLQHLTISDANYGTAWKLLNDRFNNKRKLCSVQLQALLSQPKIEVESAAAIRKLHDTTKECIHALNNLGINTTDWAPMIAHIVIQKLDFESHKLYEQGLENPRELPTYDALFRYLENRFQSLESLRDSKRRENSQVAKINRPTKIQEWTRYKTYHTSTTMGKCQHCQQSHKIYTCKKFHSLTPLERKNFIQAHKLCLNCLTHKNEEKCHSRYKCNICKQSHHTLLHQDQKVHSHLLTARTEEKTTIQSLLSKRTSNVILATVLIKAKAVDGRLEYLRALIDPGSQASFISESAAQMLGLPRTKVNAEISGLGLTSSGTVRHKITVNMLPRFSSTFSINIETLILQKLTKLLPNTRVVQTDDPGFWDNMVLADPTYDTPGPIDVIIGADTYHQIILNGIKKHNDGLVAQRTEFGWIISGQSLTPSTSTSITCMVSYAELDYTMKKFWEIESVDNPTVEPSPEDQYCEQHFQQTHIRNADGSYTVRIPFKDKVGNLGESKRRAIARLLQNEKRFTLDKRLEKDYKQFMQEYISLKHMIPTTDTDGYYLPHHAVIKEDSSTTKLRVVFDASSKTTSGLSLNDTMYIGPKLQKDLAGILLRWRKHRYVYTADIEKMYRQVKIHEEDFKYQKVLWRPSEAQPIREFCLTTVTYGTASAPYLALRTLQQLALDEQKTYPLASNIVMRDFYVDDLMTGTNSIIEAKTIQRELTSLLASGGFKLRKWTTNQQQLLETIPNEMREKELQEIRDGDIVKTLGVSWLPARDCFQFKVNMTDQKITKRSVLSNISKIYDPLGWLSPVIIQAKLLMQELWITKLPWDEELPPELRSKWNQFKTELTAVQSIKIYRWIKYNNQQNIQIHGFCDASEKAYAAVIYSRVENLQGTVTVTMLTSKTKVTPIQKDTTLPRLELCAAVLLSRLLQKTITALEIPQLSIYAWTDSTITLAWIKGDPSRWKTFVSHRVTEINSYVKSDSWHHVKSEENPADCASRGISPKQLKEHTLWWTGPKWLSLPEEQWPITPDKDFKTSKELRQQHTALLITTKSTALIERFSSLSKMLRVLTHCIRFITNCRTKHRSHGELTTNELHDTLLRVVRIVQQEHFSQEILQLSSGSALNKSSKILSLTPFLDETGIVRVGGRLDNSLLSYNEKHPMILPHSHHFSTLIIKDAHTKTLHGGNQITHAYILRRYWIIDARNAIRRNIHNCTTCCRYRRETSKQLMGKLPAPRITPSKPFTHTGVDYAGPFNIRMSSGRGTKVYKGYIAVFVCLSTKAIHLEAVGDLTSDAFLSAFKRFTSRRGFCSDLYSDCGTTFVGAKNELEKQFNTMIRKNFNDASIEIINKGTQWHFIPPAAPHFGGLWEAGVKSTKYHLKRVAGEHNFTFEEFSTLLCQIEACLNSRPLCPLSNEPKDLAVITPGHFLTGSSILVPPEPIQMDKPIHCLKRMELISRLKADFWKVWATEYLSRLQQRPKWAKPENNIKDGDLVLLTDERTSPARWPLARVVKVHPGQDGLVRVVTVQTAKATLERPVTKLCKLPFEKEDLPSPEGQRDITRTPDSITQPVNQRKKRSHPTINPTSIPPRPSIEELRRSCIPTKRPKKITTSSLLTTLLVIGLILPIPGQPIALSSEVPAESTEAMTEVQPFQHNPGIYFEDLGHLHMVNNEWNTVVYYNLSTYYQQLEGFHLCMEELSTLCNKTITYNYYCNAVLKEIQHKVQVMHENNLILHNRNGNHMHKGRQLRRAPLEIIGTLQHSLFGVLDQAYAEQIENEINKLRENENYLLHLAKNQTSITEVTANILKKNSEEIQRQFEAFDEHITKNTIAINHRLEDNELAQSFTAMTTFLNLIMNTYENIQRELITLLVDAQNGKISPSLLTPQQLRQQIQIIRKHISSALIIPGERDADELLKLYKIITVKSRITEKNIIFKIQIPLPSEGLYQLFKIYPVPTKYQSEFIYLKPSTEYLATTLHRDYFYPLSENEVKECIKTDFLGLLCQQQRPIYSIQSHMNQCEMRFLNHQKFQPKLCTIQKTSPSQYWIQLQHRNTWIYTVNEDTTINIVCQKKVKSQRLSESGIIKLGPGCAIKHQSMKIHAHSIITDFHKSSFLPTTNISDFLPNIEMKKPETIPAIPLIHLDTKGLDNAKLKINKDFEISLDNHHVHHYVSTYLIVAVILGIIIWLLYPYLPQYKKKEDTTFEVTPITPQPPRRTTSAPRRQNDQ